MISVEQKHHSLLQEAERRTHPDIANLRLCFELLALTSAIDRDCAVRLAPQNLSEGKFVVLFLLHGQPQGLPPHELADRAGVTRPTITGLLDGLERGDLQDRRKVPIRPSPKGEATARTLFVEHTRWIGTLFDGFSFEERSQFSALLQRVWRNTDAGKMARPAIAREHGP
jgi:DNA-binding MarR family transcriptional regulator